MFQPINLLMSHFNLENSQQLNRDASIAAAQQTAQSQEIAQESLRRTQIVQASTAPAESQRVHRRNEDEKEQQQKRKQQDTFQRQENPDLDDKSEKPGLTMAAPIQKNTKPTKGFDFYV